MAEVHEVQVETGDDEERQRGRGGGKGVMKGGGRGGLILHILNLPMMLIHVTLNSENNNDIYVHDNHFGRMCVSVFSLKV